VLRFLFLQQNLPSPSLAPDGRFPSLQSPLPSQEIVCSKALLSVFFHTAFLSRETPSSSVKRLFRNASFSFLSLAARTLYSVVLFVAPSSGDCNETSTTFLVEGAQMLVHAQCFARLDLSSKVFCGQRPHLPRRHPHMPLPVSAHVPFLRFTNAGNRLPSL